MKILLIIFSSIFALGQDISDDTFVDYAADFESSVLSDSSAPSTDSYQAQNAAMPDATSERDPNSAGGATEPTSDNPEAKNEEEKDFYDECVSKNNSPEQCCQTCVESYLSDWANGNCEDAEACEQSQLYQSEAAATEGQESLEGAGSAN